MLVFVDANIFYYYIFKSKYTEQAAELFKQHPNLVTSVGVLDEVMFVIIRRLVEKMLGIRRIDNLRSYIRTRGVDFAASKLEAFVELLEALDMIVLKDYSSPRELLQTITKYNLPPSDAIIALTCRHYGIDTIMTFDEDFKRIPWLRVVP